MFHRIIFESKNRLKKIVNMTTSQLELRKKALKLAVEANKTNGTPSMVLSCAQRYYDFLVNNAQ